MISNVFSIQTYAALGIRTANAIATSSQDYRLWHRAEAMEGMPGKPLDGAEGSWAYMTV